MSELKLDLVELVQKNFHEKHDVYSKESLAARRVFLLIKALYLEKTGGANHGDSRLNAFGDTDGVCANPVKEA